MKFHCVDAAALHQAGEQLAASLCAGDVVLLEGGLGAGKTTFAQGIARGLGVTEAVTSPTYAIVNEYMSGRLPLFHVDVYRLEAADELVSAGIAELVGESGVWLVEWASRFPGAWPESSLEVRIREVGEGRVVEVLGR
ncbi:hypothetical protein LBMAG42_30460 [Deltaproteobacteria bacterium]|nr:hypothetical protein LBMAG42_30460 [Deltaproteobacteria bacterium]